MLVLLWMRAKVMLMSVGPLGDYSNLGALMARALLSWMANLIILLCMLMASVLSGALWRENLVCMV